MQKKWLLGGLELFASFLVFVATAWPQGTASISGRIMDSSGSAVAGAKVTAKNLETDAARTSTTDETGFYRLLSLPVGRYDVTAEDQGFKTAVQSGINLVVGQEAVVNVSLEVGQITQEVTVSAEAPVINTTTVQTSGLVSEQQVKDLPLNGRSYDNLITLNSGTANFSAMRTAGTAQTGNLFTVSGRRIDQNVVLLNGIEWGGNGSQVNVASSASGQLLGIDAVREFNVLTDTYSSEYGKHAGAQILVVTMGGSNQLHGSAFEFLRNSVLDARNFFDQQPASLGSRIPHFTRNSFGGSLGAPIRKDKTFIFGNYEGFRQLLGLSNVAIVPDNAARTGCLPSSTLTTSDTQCATFPGINKYVGVTAGVAPYLALWPLPNGPELAPAGGGAFFFSSPDSKITENYGTVRVDHSFSDRDSLNGVYTIDDGINTTPTAVPTFVTTVGLRTQLLSLSETHIFSPAFLNAFTFGYARSYIDSFTGSITTFPANLAFVQGTGVEALSVGGSAGGTISSVITQVGNSAPTWDARNLFTIADSVQITRGKHLLSFGVWFQRVQDNSNQSLSIGKANFSSLQNLLMGNLQNFQAIPYASPLGFRSLEGAWFIQDTIKLRPNLTLTAGLRHEFTNGWNESHGRISEYVVDPNGVLQNNPIIGSNTFTKNHALFLFGPRVGLAWDVFGNGKTAVHAGGGMYYNLHDNLAVFTSRNQPFNTSYLISGGTFPFNQITPTSLPPGAQIAPTNVVPDPYTPTLIAYNLKVEQQLFAGLALSAEYVGSHGYHQIVQEDFNETTPVICGVSFNCSAVPAAAPAPAGTTVSLPNGTIFYPKAPVPAMPLVLSVPGQRLNPKFGASKSLNTIGTTSYNGLLVDVIERARHGLTFKANYTWSKALDDAVQLGFANSPSTVLNVTNLKQDWGPSTWDLRSRFSFGGSYELPFGKGKAIWKNPSGVADKLVSNWQVNSIVSLQSGFPINLQLGFNQSRSGNANIADRPSVNPNFTGNLYPRTVAHWYDATAFILPAPGTYGNVPRNSLVGPGLAALDMSFLKDIPITERLKLQFRAEGFNILNHANFGAPNLLALDATGAPRSTAGSIINTVTPSRQLQFGLKLGW